MNVTVECSECNWAHEYETLDEVPDYCPNGHQVVDETREAIARRRDLRRAVSAALLNGESLESIAWRLYGQVS